MPKKVLNTLFSSLNSQSGQSTVYIILVIVVIIFAVMLAGGGGSLFTGNEPSSITDEPSPTVSANSTPGSTTTTPTPDASWSIDIVEGTCQTGKSSFKQENITAKGSTDGTITLEIENPVGTWKLDAAIPFHSPAENYSVKLDNATGYNTKNWRIKLSSGGVEKVIKTGPPTGCN